MFAGDLDRERAAAALQHHYVRGRLTLDELSVRTGRVLAARSTADIRSALSGLPGRHGRGPSMGQMVARGAVLAVCTGAYLFFSVTLLLVLALMAIIQGVSDATLVAFLVVWLVPTYFLSRLWRGGLRRATHR
jgi:choline-glycine betaine transporter